MQLKDLKKSFSAMTMKEKRRLIKDIREARLTVVIPVKKKAKAKMKAKIKRKKSIDEMTMEELLAEAAKLRKLIDRSK